jgi:hypothetical protein
MPTSKPIPLCVSVSLCFIPLAQATPKSAWVAGIHQKGKKGRKSHGGFAEWPQKTQAASRQGLAARG